MEYTKMSCNLYDTDMQDDDELNKIIDNL